VSKTLLITVKMTAITSLKNMSSLTVVLKLYHTICFKAPVNTVAQSVTFSKSEVDVAQYFDKAIDLLSTVIKDTYVDCDSTDHHINHIQGNLNVFQFKVNHEFQYVHKQFDQVNKHFKKVDECLDKVDKHLNKVDEHLNKVNECLNKVNRHLNKVNRHLKQIDEHLNKVKCHLEVMKNNMNKQFRHNLAFQRN